MKAVSFYENCSRIVLRAVEEFEAVGHEGSDTRFHCELLTTPGTRSNRKIPVYFFLSLFSTPHSRIHVYNPHILRIWNFRDQALGQIYPRS